VSRGDLKVRIQALVREYSPKAAETFKASENFMRGLLSDLDIVHRRATTSAPKIPDGVSKDELREIYLARLAHIVRSYQIPSYMAIFADETNLFLVPSRNTTLEAKGAKYVQILGQGALL
jgi:hypothetical protein